ncbi:MAG TPA: hypothetical protein VFJ47_12395, partial [Terriglobales bacterium]|nr:hypothetical protein [Terriglobales bacterium]
VIETRKPGHEFVAPATLFTKLNYESWCSLRWQTWPDDEKQAISAYLRALWKAVLNSNPEDLPWDGAYGWIEGIAQAEHDLSQYLHEWLEASSVNAHRNLASMILNHNPTNIKRPAGGFWEGHREQWEQLVAWARLPVVRQKLTDGLDRWGGEPFANEFLEAAVLLPSDPQG